MTSYIESAMISSVTNKNELSLIQSGGGTKDLRSHGNPGKPEGANLSEQSNNKRIDDEISGQSFGTDL